MPDLSPPCAAHVSISFVLSRFLGCVCDNAFPFKAHISFCRMNSSSSISSAGATQPSHASGSRLRTWTLSSRPTFYARCRRYSLAQMRLALTNCSNCACASQGAMPVLRQVDPPLLWATLPPRHLRPFAAGCNRYVSSCGRVDLFASGGSAPLALCSPAGFYVILDR